ncbi:hypothetical protein K1719_016872 [Acacia pycnantha]|nr:hypothetical protein K1719_016872 [Acacia pycnantha]
MVASLHPIMVQEYELRRRKRVNWKTFCLIFIKQARDLILCRCLSTASGSICPPSVRVLASSSIRDALVVKLGEQYASCLFFPLPRPTSSSFLTASDVNLVMI